MKALTQIFFMPQIQTGRIDLVQKTEQRRLRKIGAENEIGIHGMVELQDAHHLFKRAVPLWQAVIGLQLVKKIQQGGKGVSAPAAQRGKGGRLQLMGIEIQKIKNNSPLSRKYM